MKPACCDRGTMSDWIDVANAGDFPHGATRVLYVEDVAIAMINLDGQYHALENLCTHDNATLIDGSCNPDDLIDSGEITCPRHGARFCIRTGEALSPPAYEPVSIFPTRIENGMVQVMLE